MKNDKRKSVRRSMHYTAWIARKGEPLEGCVLSDISDKGARLDVESVEKIPDEFMLFLSNRGTPRRYCTVAWRTEDQVGVKFEAPPAGPKTKGNSKVQAMIAARQASLQPDADADAKAEADAEAADAPKAEKESA
jgi:hypothetical protein